MNEQNQTPGKSRNTLRNILVALGLLVVVILFGLMFIEPMVGNVFSSINSDLSSLDGGDYVVTDGGYAAFLVPASAEQPRQAVTTDRLIIRNGQLTLTVKDTIAAQKEVEAIVAELKEEDAFVVSANERASYEGASPYIDMAIRVPADKFDEVMDRLAAMAVNVEGRSETAQDVTEEFVDLNTRLESLEAARDRLLQIMKEADTAEELLLAEQQLTQREAEIESLKGRIKYLSESARLSSITISLLPYRPDQPLDTRWRPAETVRNAFDALINSLRGFADFLILFVIAILPWLALIGAIWWGVRQVMKKRREKSQAGSSAPESKAKE
ncbi:MAG: DUF4349 domain-containing protein [Chloroflexota bacterium]